MASPAPVMLIPPSEGKADGGDGSPIEWGGGCFGSLAPRRLEVVEAVRRELRRRGRAGTLLGVGGPHLERALAEWRDMDDAGTLPAAERYSGVVWGGLDLASLSSAARRRAMARIVVPSGLWGLVAARDPIPPYRLKMGARVTGLGLMSSWWRPVVSDALAARAKRAAVIDLLPQEHRAAIDPSALRPGALVRVDIIEGDAGARRSVGHAGKHLKGRLARALMESDARTADDVAGIAMPDLALLSVERGEVVQVTFRRCS